MHGTIANAIACFSDGVEADYLAFDSGTTATIGAARETANLVVP